jgi:hypothetical protein
MDRTRPKSAILGVPSAVSRVLAGLRSRWMKPIGAQTGRHWPPLWSYRQRRARLAACQPTSRLAFRPRQTSSRLRRPRTVFLNFLCVWGADGIQSSVEFALPLVTRPGSPGGRNLGRGPPFYLGAGKNLPVNCREVVARLRRPPSLFPLCTVPANYFRFRIGPDMTIGLGATAMDPAESMCGQEVELQVKHEGKW